MPCIISKPSKKKYNLNCVSVITFNYTRVYAQSYTLVKLKGKLYKIAIQRTIVYGRKCWASKWQHIHK